MRKVTQQAVNALLNDQQYTNGNTQVRANNGFTNLYLHNHIIATKSWNPIEISITNAGWFSNTTKERLNGLPGVSIQQKKGVWYLNGKEWDGTLINVSI